MQIGQLKGIEGTYYPMKKEEEKFSKGAKRESAIGHS